MRANNRLGLVALVLTLTVCGCTPDASPSASSAIEIESDEVSAHRLTDYQPIRDSFSTPGMDIVPVRLVVATDGRVATAFVETNPRWGGTIFPARVQTKAEREARSWRYRPFRRRGVPVAVTFVESITIYPPEHRPTRLEPMPAFGRDVRIRLVRTPCFGTCPHYAVEIAADGSVKFDGRDYVFAPGRHRARIPPAAVRSVYDLARQAAFFSLRDSYRAEITDQPTFIVTIHAGGRRKMVVDYAGEMVGMPSAIRDLEDAIDAAAGTRRWIEGDDQTIAGLIAEGFDFSSFDGARMLAAAAGAGHVLMVAQLIEKGAPLRATRPGDRDRTAAALPMAAFGGHHRILSLLLSQRRQWSRSELHEALESAVAGKSYESFRLLTARGALTGIRPEQATELLARAVESGDTRLVAQILRLRPDVNRIRPNYPDSPILADAAAVTCPWNRQPPACDPPRVVALLLRAGADPRRVNPITPSSPLSFVSDVRVARLLLAAGADPNFVNFEGEPPIFSIYHEDVALTLLAAGADPRARRPGDGMTVAGWARYQQWPRVLARVRAQGMTR